MNLLNVSIIDIHVLCNGRVQQKNSNFQCIIIDLLSHSQNEKENTTNKLISHLTMNKISFVYIDIYYDYYYYRNLVFTLEKKLSSKYGILMGSRYNDPSCQGLGNAVNELSLELS